MATDSIDEGVKLLSKLKHGETFDEANAVGAGTRSRRSAVKVICVARCPHGGHFATGSDDGVCRVWLDEDDPAVKLVDDMFRADGSRRKSGVEGQQRHPMSSRTRSSERQRSLEGTYLGT